MALTPDSLRRALEEEEYARQWTNALVKQLREAGHSWASMSAATGLTVSALRWRAGEMRRQSVATQQRRITLRRWMSEQWEAAKASGALDTRERSRLGANVRRGFTTQPALIAALEPWITTERDGAMGFEGLDAKSAQVVSNLIPAQNLSRVAVRSAPRIGEILSAIIESKGTMTGIGYVVPPHRADERVVLTGVFMEGTGDRAHMLASVQRLWRKADRPHDIIRLPDGRWRVEWTV